MHAVCKLMVLMVMIASVQSLGEVNCFFLHTTSVSYWLLQTRVCKSRYVYLLVNTFIRRIQARFRLCLATLLCNKIMYSERRVDVATIWYYDNW